MFHSGSGKRRVDLGGRSSKTESREQVLARTRAEREARRVQKVETQSAIRIQALWRAKRAVGALRDEARRSWQKSFGEFGERAMPDVPKENPSFLRSLCFFVRVANEQDVRRLATASRLLLSAYQTTGELPLGSHETSMHTLRRLVQLSLQALTFHRSAFSSQLAAPRRALTDSSSVPALLTELLLTLTGKDAWVATVGPDAADAAVRQLLAWLAMRVQLHRSLALLLDAAVPAPGAAADVSGGRSPAASQATATPPPGTPPLQQAVPAAEALVTILTSRSLAGLAGMEQQLQLAALLGVPLLWRRAPTLRAVAPQLVRSATAALSALPPRQLAVALADSSAPSSSAAFAAAAVLGNLLEIAPVVLQDSKLAAAAFGADVAAEQLLNTVQSLMSVLPLGLLLADSTAVGGDEDGLAAGGVQRISKSDQLELQPDFHLPPAMAAQLSSAASESLLRFLVQRILPAADAASAAALKRQQQGQQAQQQQQQQHQQTAQQPRINAAAAPAFGRPSAAPAFGSPQSAAFGSQRAAFGSSAASSSSSSSSPAPTVHNSAADSSIATLLQFLNQVLEVPALRRGALITLAVRASFVERLWFSHLRGMQAAAGRALPPNIATWGPPLVLLARVHSVYLLTVGDGELAGRGAPLPPGELYDGGRPAAGLLPMLTAALWQVLWVDAAPGAGVVHGAGSEAVTAAHQLREDVRDAAGRLGRQLFDCNSQRAFAPAAAFAAESVQAERFLAEARIAAAAPGGVLEAVNSRVSGLLKHAPYLVQFQERAHVFATLVATEKRARAEQEFAHGRHYGGVPVVTIRRSQLLSDGFSHLNLPGEVLRGRVRIQFVNEHGMEEAGIDGGGLFKDFMEHLVKEGFDPNVGLFAATSDNRLYPNPNAPALVPEALQLLEFLGRMLGKAMFEGILLELPLAGFFLKKFRPGAWCDVNDLPTLDAELYRNLMRLRDYSGDASDLALTFTIADSTFGAHREVELVPGGREVAVTDANKLAYIHRVADYRLNTQLAGLTAAFRAGLSEVIPPAWTAMFAPGELQTLISGAGGGALDVDDLAAHAEFAGGYHREHPIIANLWEALRSFSPEDQGAFLRFVTSVSRGPLLGFRYLEPPLCIQMAGGALNEASAQRLPSAATCMNLLKLPPYKSLGEMRSKLLYAIHEVAGFDLS